jgi:hypothetical protein
MNILSSGAKIKDGTICIECQVRSKLKIKQFAEYDTVSLKEHINQIVPNFFPNKLVRDSFNATKNIEKYLYIDEGNRKFMIGKEGFIFNYSDLVGYELLEDNETLTKGGLGSTIVGGLIAGGTGAIVGGVIGAKKSKSTCESLHIKLTVKNYVSDAVYINFIGLFEKGIKTDSIIYGAAKNNAQKCLSALMIIAKENETVVNQTINNANIDSASEIQKFYDLMKNGIITEDEFNAKKASLLGL